MTSTRSDLTYAINNCARYMNNSDKEHSNVLKRI